jgi:UDP-GlcNAc:undecaprenyl-phosphate GlcNAc-1-phosphate transferase
MILFSTFLISTIITIILMPFLIDLARKTNLLDIPNNRKIHCDPVPRIGGLAMALGAFIPIIIWVPMSEFVKAVLIGSGILVIFGLVDDIREIGFKTKFIGQILAGLIVILYGGLKIQSLGMFAPSGLLLPGFVDLFMYWISFLFKSISSL